MNGADILIIIVVAVLVTAAILTMIRNKNKGKSGCGGDCFHCGYDCRKTHRK